MEKDLTKLRAFRPAWWNPLTWVLMVLAPLTGVLLGGLAGLLTGLLVGYERGLDVSVRMVRKLIARLP